MYYTKGIGKENPSKPTSCRRRRTHSKPPQIRRKETVNFFLLVSYLHSILL